MSIEYWALYLALIASLTVIIAVLYFINWLVFRGWSNEKEKDKP